MRDSRGNSGDVVFADITTDLNLARENGDPADHARILQTLLLSGPLTGIRVDLGQLVLEVPELRVTVIDAASAMRYKLLNPRAVRTIPLPARRDIGENPSRDTS